jgi:CubicO group peptidase (beta-lactamase class C family)
MLLSFALSLVVSAIAEGDVVEADPITAPAHRANLGKVWFLAKTIPLEKLAPAEQLQRFTLCERCDLEVRVFLATSLTNALHRVAPTLTADELVQQGNYQVTFRVDDQPTYVETLPPGAGSPERKHRQTTFRVPLISSSNEDSWGRFLWNRFLLRGGEDALTEGTHRLTIEFRPAVKAAVGDVLASGTLTLQVVRPKVTARQLAVQVRPGSGFERSDANLDEAKIRELNRRVAQRTIKDLTSIVVLRDGKLLLEEYFNGATRETLHDTRSVGKSFASALVGLALRDGFLSSVETPLGELYDLKTFANPSPAKAEVTVRDLLTMTSTFDGDDNDSDSAGNEENMYPTSNWVKFALDLPMRAGHRGVDWAYFTAGAVLLGDVLNRRVPQGLERYADRALFKPLGITRYSWAYTPQHVVSTAGGLKLRSLDLAKFGQLYANHGKWNGAQVLPASWVDETFTPRAELPEGRGHYGYLFWNTTYDVDHVAWSAFNASGNGGNKIFVFQNQPVVVVITATAFNTPYMHAQVDRLMEQLVLPAISH